MSLKGKEVLIVDDTAELRLLARRIAENAGMIAIEADSVKAANRILTEKVPHLILLDLMMPEQSGFALLAQRAAQRAFRKIPVIVVSAVTDRASVHRAIALGATDYAIKPYSASVLLRKIRKALQDTEFRSYSFPKHEEPKLVASVTARIARPSETGFYVESAIKLGVGVPVRIKCDAFADLGLEDSVFLTVQSPGLRGDAGTYFARINVAGLSKPLTRKLRKAG